MKYEKIYVFSNVEFSREDAPEAGENDLLVFLNRAAGISLYRDHFLKIVYHRSPDPSYGEEVMGCVNRYVFGAGSAGIPEEFISTLKRTYDWNYEIEQGKVKSATTGYMVVRYLAHLYPDAKIILVNFGFQVKRSTYRCPWHNWQFEGRELAGFEHVYTSSPKPSGTRKKVFLKIPGLLGDNVYSSAVVQNMVSAGLRVNAGGDAIACLWDSNPFLDWSVTEETADLIIRLNHTQPWTIGCRHIIEACTETAAFDTGCRIPVRFRRPHVWMAVPKAPLLGMDYVVINTGYQPSCHAKKWSESAWSELIRMFPEVRFVQMGKRSSNARPVPGAVSMIDATKDLPDLFRLIRDADCVISPPSGAIHIAAAYHRPAIMLSGGREPAELAGYPETHVLSACGSMDCCRTGGCRMCWFSGTKKVCKAFRTAAGDPGPTAECMLSITPENVAEELRKILAKKKGRP